MFNVNIVKILSFCFVFVKDGIIIVVNVSLILDGVFVLVLMLVENVLNKGLVLLVKIVVYVLNL